jgi:hypothetical protein
VELVNPLISFNASVARQDARNWPAGGWFPEQRMTRDEALKSMTLWPAYAAFQEHELGSLAPGKYADFVVLDQDIMRVPDGGAARDARALHLGGRPQGLRAGSDPDALQAAVHRPHRADGGVLAFAGSPPTSGAAGGHAPHRDAAARTPCATCCGRWPRPRRGPRCSSRPGAESAAPAQRALMTLIGWSFGEGVALFGIVQHFTGAAMSHDGARPPDLRVHSHGPPGPAGRR